MSVDRLKAELFPVNIYSGTPLDSDAPHDKGFFGDPDVFRSLISSVRPKTIVEIGSWKGHSAVFMVDCLRREGIFCDVVCVDTWLGSQEHWLKSDFRKLLKLTRGRPSFYEDFLSNIVSARAESFVLPLSLPSATAAEVLRHYEVSADLIYVDAGHGYSDVMGDITSYFDLVAPGGIMFGDDFPHNPLKKAVRDFARLKGLQIWISGRKWIYYKGDTTPPLSFGGPDT